MPKPISADYIYELPTVGQAAVSPDGERVAYVRSQVDGETKRSASHIELVPFSGGASRQITAGTTDRMPRWA